MKILLAVFLLTLTSCSAQQQRAAYSATATQITVGKGPNSVVIADFNRDGKPDIAVTNADEGTVTVLLGDGKGKFTEATGSPFPAGNSPNDICVADFNGDGIPDLAFANHEMKSLTVLLGDGHGGFTPAPGSPVAVLSYPHTHGVAAGDFNGDGKLDLVTESWGDDKVTVIFGDGHGRFASNHTRLARQPSQGVIAVRVGPDIHLREQSRGAALVASKDLGHFARQNNFPTALREPQSAEKPPSLLDFYLSW